MTSLFVLELRRIVSRRLVRMMVLAVFVMLTLISVVISFNKSNDLGAHAAEVRASVEQQYATSPNSYGFTCDRESAYNEITEFDPVTGQPRELPEGCRYYTLDDIVEQQLQYSDPRFVYVREAPDLLRAGIVIAALLAFLLSASVIGAEWGSGMFASLLTWEPRRWRVLAAKTAAAFVCFTVVGGLIVGFQLLASAGLAETRGTFDGVTSEFNRTSPATRAAASH